MVFFILDLRESRSQLLIVHASSEELQNFVYQYDWEREGEDEDPFFHADVANSEDLGQEGHVDDDEVAADGAEDGQDQVGVDPGRHDEERVVLGKRVEGVQHFNDDKHGK